MPSSSLNHVLTFPKTFLFGSAVAPFQVEGIGGIRKTDWDTFLHHNPDTITPEEKGPQWWNITHAKHDISVMSSLGLKTQRIGLEWGRIEPEEGNINTEAIQYYQKLIAAIEELGMQPIVTINHYVLPEWIAKKGSWNTNQIIKHFTQFVHLVVTKFPSVQYWITLNEPNVLIDAGYFSRYYPPQSGNLLDALIARSNMFTAHKQAYGVIKHFNPTAQVGIAFGFRWYRPADPNSWLENLYAEAVKYVDSISYVHAVENYLDFIGCNYYTGYYLNLNLRNIRITQRTDAHRMPKHILFGETKRPDAYVTDYGWPIVPDFFLDLLRALHKTWRKPIFITENGLADEKDHDRAFYILLHLTAVWRAIEEGIDIQQYLYWSTIDNLEWTQGYREHFGLLSLDPVTSERKLRESSGLYKDIATKGKIELEYLLNTYITDIHHRREAEKNLHILLKGEMSNKIAPEDE